ncbi:M48 family metallopeptidase [Rothia sp. CCM 9418]|uniref:M48 metallopeptidase family protein n=1 Tax=Rothia sp. CCM 9418 TaxID=3402661 RepID=UPI003ADF28E4
MRKEQERRQIIPATETHPEIMVRFSNRRKKTISARYLEESQQIELSVPAHSTAQDLDEYIERILEPMMRKIQRKGQERRHYSSDKYLRERARYILDNYLPESEEPLSIRWVKNQHHRWGSATVRQRSIRISHLLQGAPEYVIDQVIHHELCHFVEPNHSVAFRMLERRYPHYEQATAFLSGMVFASRSERTPLT